MEASKRDISMVALRLPKDDVNQLYFPVWISRYCRIPVLLYQIYIHQFQMDLVSFKQSVGSASHQAWRYEGNKLTLTCQWTPIYKSQWYSSSYCSVSRWPKYLPPRIKIKIVLISNNLRNNHLYVIESILFHLLPHFWISNNKILL